MLAQINPRQTLLHMLPKASVGAEIGVWRGDFSQEILHTVKPQRLYLIDPWRINPSPTHAKAWYGTGSGVDMDAIHTSVCGRFAGAITRGVVHIVRESSVEALSALPDESLDFAYVDGDHSYEGVRADLELCLRKVKVTGLICGDDYALGSWWRDGVVRAVNEFIGSHPVQIRLLLDSQYALQKLGR